MFIVFLSAILALMTVYLWKRLVKDTTAPGRTRPRVLRRRHLVLARRTRAARRGEMWPFHHVARLVQPSLAGLSRVQDTQLYVTRGAGFWGPPVRIGAPPDITVLSLEP